MYAGKNMELVGAEGEKAAVAMDLIAVYLSAARDLGRAAVEWGWRLRNTSAGTAGPGREIPEVVHTLNICLQ